MRLLEWIKRQDYYMETPTFKVKGEDGFQTIFGGILFLLYVLINLVLTLYYFISTYTDYKPTVTSASRSRELELVSAYDKDNFEFVLAFYEETHKGIKGMNILNPTSSFTHEKFDLNAEDPHSIENIGQFSKCLDVENELHPENPFNTAKNIKGLSDSMICSHFDKDLEIGGDFISNHKKNNIEGHFKFDTCLLEGITPQQCNSNEELSKFSLQQGFHWSFIYLNNHIDNLVPHGFSNFTDDIESKFDLGVDHKIIITYTRHQIDIDNNYIFNFFPNSNHAFHSIEVEHRLIPKEQEANFVRIEIEVNLNRIEFSHLREYTKMDSIIANIGAVTYLVDVAFGAIIAFFNYCKMDIYMFNKTYQIMDNKSKISKSNIPFEKINSTSRPQSITASPNNLRVSDNRAMDTERKEDILHINKVDDAKSASTNRPIVNNYSRIESNTGGRIHFNSKITSDHVKKSLTKSKINISLWDTIWAEFYPECIKLNDEQKKYKVASAYLTYDLDVTTYLQMVQDFEKLRDFVLKDEEKLQMLVDQRRIVNAEMDYEEMEQQVEDEMEKMNNLNDSLIEKIHKAVHSKEAAYLNLNRGSVVRGKTIKEFFDFIQPHKEENIILEEDKDKNKEIKEELSINEI